MEIKELAVTAAGIIFDNEGNYGSVNKNDNRAVSIGKFASLLIHESIYTRSNCAAQSFNLVITSIC